MRLVRVALLELVFQPLHTPPTVTHPPVLYILQLTNSFTQLSVVFNFQKKVPFLHTFNVPCQAGDTFGEGIRVHLATMSTFLQISNLNLTISLWCILLHYFVQVR